MREAPHLLVNSSVVDHKFLMFEFDATLSIFQINLLDFLFWSFYRFFATRGSTPLYTWHFPPRWILLVIISTNFTSSYSQFGCKRFTILSLPVFQRFSAKTPTQRLWHCNSISGASNCVSFRCQSGVWLGQGRRLCSLSLLSSFFWHKTTLYLLNNINTKDSMDAIWDIMKNSTSVYILTRFS
jgi:hypothetical protein